MTSPRPRGRQTAYWYHAGNVDLAAAVPKDGRSEIRSGGSPGVSRQNMLGNATPTPLDLRFSLFGIPVRVHPLFWLVGVLLGWNAFPRDKPDIFVNQLLLWLACFFVSILVHELGHALTALAFGWPPEIVLYAFGGYAAFLPTWGYTTTRAVLILLAGPGAGIALFGAVWCVEWGLLEFRLIPQDPDALKYLFGVLIQMQTINLWWSLMNLLPVFPLDGGQISREVFTHFRPRDGLEISLKLSLVAGGAVAGYFLTHDQVPTGLLFGLLAVQSVQHLQAMRFR